MKFPAAQLEHALAPATAYIPCVQEPQADEATAPSSEENWPAAQLVQLDAPVAEAYLPAAKYLLNLRFLLIVFTVLFIDLIIVLPQLVHRAAPVEAA
jgi:hypothetical protein